jgi:hypothetical protein
LDKERFVRDFAQSLRRRGFQVWLDEKSLKTGEPFWDRIGRAIESCDFVIVILSQNSFKSHGVLEELRTAQVFNLDQVKVLPIRIDPVNYGTIPVHLRSRHILDFVGWEDKKVLSARIAKLASDILSFWEAGNSSNYGSASGLETHPIASPKPRTAEPAGRVAWWPVVCRVWLPTKALPRKKIHKSARLR